MVKSRAKAGRRTFTKARSKIVQKSECCKILVLGIGGAGGDIVNRLVESGVSGAKCAVADTDLQQLNKLKVQNKLLIGEKAALGLGAHGNPGVGRAAITESEHLISDLLKGVEVVFIAAGFGGGTGSGAAPVVADIARRNGAIAVGVVTTSLNVENEKIALTAFALNEMRRACDTVFVIDHAQFLESVSNLPPIGALKFAERVTANTIKSIVESISIPGLINLEIADFKTMVQNGGVATVTIGESDAPNRAEEAVAKAFKSPPLDADFAGATGALVHVSGDSRMKIEEANRVGSIVTDILGHDAIVKWGAKTSPSSDGFLKVTLVMTGFQPQRMSSWFGVLMPKLYDIESSYSEPEKRLQINLCLDQIENFEE